MAEEVITTPVETEEVKTDDSVIINLLTEIQSSIAMLTEQVTAMTPVKEDTPEDTPADTPADTPEDTPADTPPEENKMTPEEIEKMLFEK